MRLTPELTIRPLATRGSEEPPNSEIVVDGNPSGKLVPGAALEAAIAQGGRYLLLTSDDSVFEEVLGL